MRRLFLLRHAKAVATNEMPDHERPLAPRGREAAQLMARYMADEGLLPDIIIASSSVRTQETFGLMAGVINNERTILKTDPRIYEARIDILRQVILEVPASLRNLMLIGHNPGMSELAYLLCDPYISASNDFARMTLKYPTAALAVVETQRDDWFIQPRSARLERFVTPRSIGGVDED